MTPYTHLPETPIGVSVKQLPGRAAAGACKERPMARTVPVENSDLEFDYGTFDSAGFTAKTLANWQSLAAVIDHTLLNPEATRRQVERLCEEAVRYRFACAMVNPMWASTAVSALAGTGIPVGVAHRLSARRVAGLHAAPGSRRADPPGRARARHGHCPSASSRAATTRAFRTRSTLSRKWPMAMAPFSR